MKEASGDARASEERAQQLKCCRACGNSKSLNEFYAASGCLLGVRPDCIDCMNVKRRERYENDPSLKEKRRQEYVDNAEAARAAAKVWRLENIEHAKAKAKEWREANSEQNKKSIAQWREDNPDRIKEYSKDYYRENRDEILENKRVFRSLNQDHIRERDRKYDRTGIDKRRRSTPKGKLSANMQRGIRRGILSGSKSGRRTFELLGYSVDELKAHLEALFEDGMSWENYGEWHIDHKIPLAAHNYETPDDIDFKRAWSLDNLQPLWAEDNWRKNARLTSPFQPSLAF